MAGRRSDSVLSEAELDAMWDRFCARHEVNRLEYWLEKRHIDHLDGQMNFVRYYLLHFSWKTPINWIDEDWVGYLFRMNGPDPDDAPW